MRLNFSRETPLSQQAHRHPADLLRHSNAKVPEPIAKMESFAEGLAEIKRRWLSASGNRDSLDSLAHEAEQFDRMVGDAKSVTDLVDGLKSGRVFQVAELVRLLGLFGEHASDAPPTLVKLVRQHFEKPERGVLGYQGLAEWAQALANIGPASTAELKVLLREGKDSERTFAIVVVGLLGERAALCLPELIALLDSEDPAVVDSALWGLAAVGPAAADAVPRVMLAPEKNPAVSPKVAGVLYSIGPAAADETLKLVLKPVYPAWFCPDSARR